MACAEVRFSRSWFSPFLLAIALTPAFMQTQYTCKRSGDTRLESLEFEVLGVNQIKEFDPALRVYDVWLPEGATTATIRVQTMDPDARATWYVPDCAGHIPGDNIGVGGGEVTVDLPPDGCQLYIGVFPPGAAANTYIIPINPTCPSGDPCYNGGVPGTCSGNVCETSCVPTAEICDDGIDNDCDGLVDSADLDCEPLCEPTPVDVYTGSFSEIVLACGESEVMVSGDLVVQCPIPVPPFIETQTSEYSYACESDSEGSLRATYANTPTDCFPSISLVDGVGTGGCAVIDQRDAPAGVSALPIGIFACCVSGSTPQQGDDLGNITGETGVITATELDSASPYLFENTIDFGSDPYDSGDYDRLSPSAQAIAGGNETAEALSKAFAFEVLRRAEGAQLLKTEGEIDYVDPNGEQADLLVDIAGRAVGVTVVRAVGFPPEAFDTNQARALLEDRLGEVISSTANVVPSDLWTKQVLHVLAYSTAHAVALEEAYAEVSFELRSDTIVLITVTEGEDGHLY